VFGSPHGEYVEDFKTAWESLLLAANSHDTKRTKPGARVDRAKLLNVTDEELRKRLEVTWKRRTLKAVSGGRNG